MDNKRYLDKVIGSLVRSTNINYDNNLITFPFYPLYPYSVTHPSSLYSISSSYYFVSSLKEYCKNIFGLTDDEIDYVSKEYKSIILDKIENGQ